MLIRTFTAQNFNTLDSTIKVLLLTEEKLVKSWLNNFIGFMSFSSSLLSSENETDAGAERGAGAPAVHSPGGHTHRDHVEDRGQANRRGHGSKVHVLFVQVYKCCMAVKLVLSLCVLFTPVIKSRRIRWTGHVAYVWDMRNVYKVLVGKPERDRPLGRLWHGWEDNIKIDLKETGSSWIHLARDRVQW